jgi:hypothetical protein
MNANTNLAEPSEIVMPIPVDNSYIDQIPDDEKIEMKEEAMAKAEVFLDELRRRVRGYKHNQACKQAHKDKVKRSNRAKAKRAKKNRKTNRRK